MSISRSKLYDQIHDETYEAYSRLPVEGEHPMETKWRKTYGAKWRNRVGIPRLVADSAASAALALLRSINPGLFRNDPEMLERLRAAQDAAQEFAVELGRENWRRFEGRSNV